METIDIVAVANLELKDIAKGIAELEAYEISDFFLQVVEAQGNPLVAKGYAESLMAHYNKWVNGD